MALVLADRVKETTTSTGTTAINLAGAATGYQTFSSAVGDANTTYYTIADQTGANWEVGIGTYTTSGNTLSRDTVLSSSNAGSLVDFTTGVKDVFVSYPAEKALYSGGDIGTPASGTLTNCTGYTYANLSGTVPTWNQNTTGTAANVTGLVAVANGGTGTATPALVAGSNVTITGTWPNQTIAASSGGSATKTISNKTAAYTVVTGDLGTIINCTSGTFNVSLTAAASLGSGFTCTIWNTSNNNTHVITIDPNGTELIDGKATLILRRGEGLAIVCNGTGWLTDDKKPMRGYAENLNSGDTRPVASNDGSLAIGSSSTSSGSYGYAIGYLTQATGLGSAAIGVGYGTAIVAGANYSTAIGQNSTPAGSVTATGAGAMALGGSYASGIDSFAAAIANNTSTYGATGGNSVAMGYLCKSAGSASVAIGGSCNADGTSCVAIGGSSQANFSYSVAIGSYARGDRYGKYAFSSGGNLLGGYQYGLIVLRAATTGATATVLTSDGGGASSLNQVILQNNSAYTFSALIVARQQAAGGTQAASWKVEGLIRRESTAATATLVSSTTTTISNVPAWTLAVSADTTNGGLTITATGAAATNIRWVATVQTAEVIYE